MMLWFWLSANFLISRIIDIETTNEACRGEYAVIAMFLKGHTFKAITVDSPTRCQMVKMSNVKFAIKEDSTLMNLSNCKEALAIKSGA